MQGKCRAALTIPDLCGRRYAGEAVPQQVRDFEARAEPILAKAGAVSVMRSPLMPGSNAWKNASFLEGQGQQPATCYLIGFLAAPSAALPVCTGPRYNALLTRGSRGRG